MPQGSAVQGSPAAVPEPHRPDAGAARLHVRAAAARLRAAAGRPGQPPGRQRRPRPALLDTVPRGGQRQRNIVPHPDATQPQWSHPSMCRPPHRHAARHTRLGPRHNGRTEPAREQHPSTSTPPSGLNRRCLPPPSHRLRAPAPPQPCRRARRRTVSPAAGAPLHAFALPLLRLSRGSLFVGRCCFCFNNLTEQFCQKKLSARASSLGGGLNPNPGFWGPTQWGSVPQPHPPTFLCSTPQIVREVPAEWVCRR